MLDFSIAHFTNIKKFFMKFSRKSICKFELPVSLPQLAPRKSAGYSLWPAVTMKMRVSFPLAGCVMLLGHHEPNYC